MAKFGSELLKSLLDKLIKYNDEMSAFFRVFYFVRVDNDSIRISNVFLNFFNSGIFWSKILSRSISMFFYNATKQFWTNKTIFQTLIKNMQSFSKLHVPRAIVFCAGSAIFTTMFRILSTMNIEFSQTGSYVKIRTSGLSKWRLILQMNMYEY